MNKRKGKANYVFLFLRILKLYMLYVPYVLYSVVYLVTRQIFRPRFSRICLSLFHKFKRLLVRRGLLYFFTTRIETKHTNR